MQEWFLSSPRCLGPQLGNLEVTTTGGWNCLQAPSLTRLDWDESKTRACRPGRLYVASPYDSASSQHGGLRITGLLTCHLRTPSMSIPASTLLLMTKPWKSHCNLRVKTIIGPPNFKGREIRLSFWMWRVARYTVEEHVRWKELSSLENTICYNVVVIVVVRMLLLVVLKLFFRMANTCRLFIMSFRDSSETFTGIDTFNLQNSPRR